MKIKHEFTISENSQIQLINDDDKLNAEELFIEEIIVSSFGENMSESYYSIYQSTRFVEVEDSEHPGVSTYVAEVNVDESGGIKLICKYISPNIIQLINTSKKSDRYIQVVVKEYYDEFATIPEVTTTEPEVITEEQTPVIEQVKTYSTTASIEGNVEVLEENLNSEE